MAAHTAAKTLLFCSAAGIEAAAGSDDLEALRGMGRRTPWSGAGLAVGAVTLAGLPPTAGFVSEWFLATVTGAGGVVRLDTHAQPQQWPGVTRKQRGRRGS